MTWGGYGFPGSYGYFPFGKGGKGFPFSKGGKGFPFSKGGASSYSIPSTTVATSPFFW